MIAVSERKFYSLVTTLRYIYGIVAIIIGADKFFNFIVDWNIYVSPFVLSYLPLFWTIRFVYVVGIIEIIAGCIILIPRWTCFGAYLVVAWIGFIIIDLFMIGDLYDIILRDIVIAVGYFTLAKLVELEETSRATNV